MALVNEQKMGFGLKFLYDLEFRDETSKKKKMIQVIKFFLAYILVNHI